MGACGSPPPTECVVAVKNLLSCIVVFIESIIGPRMVVRLSNTAQSRRKRGDPANTTAAPPFSHECMWRARRRATRVYLVLERVRAATPFIVEKEVSCGPSAPGRFHQPQARDIC